MRRIKERVHQNLTFTQDLSRNSKQRIREFISPNSFGCPIIIRLYKDQVMNQKTRKHSICLLDSKFLKKTYARTN